jgi:hypothetical protein
MSISYDDKGKIFTDVVAKEGIHALIQTSTHLIRATLHVRHGERVKDELDRDEPFLALTGVSILGPGEKILHQAPFLAVQRNQIVWVLPQEAAGEEGA